MKVIRLVVFPVIVACMSLVGCGPREINAQGVPLGVNTVICLEKSQVVAEETEVWVQLQTSFSQGSRAMGAVLKRTTTSPNLYCEYFEFNQAGVVGLMSNGYKTLIVRGYAPGSNDVIEARVPVNDTKRASVFIHPVSDNDPETLVVRRTRNQDKPLF